MQLAWSVFKRSSWWELYLLPFDLSWLILTLTIPATLWTLIIFIWIVRLSYRTIRRLFRRKDPDPQASGQKQSDTHQQEVLSHSEGVETDNGEESDDELVDVWEDKGRFYYKDDNGYTHDVTDLYMDIMLEEAEAKKKQKKKKPAHVQAGEETNATSSDEGAQRQQEETAKQSNSKKERLWRLKHARRSARARGGGTGQGEAGNTNTQSTSNNNTSNPSQYAQQHKSGAKGKRRHK